MATARTYDAATLTASRAEFRELVDYLVADSEPLPRGVESIRDAVTEMLDD